MEQTPNKKLYRSRTDRYIAGVCGGIGQYFNIDPIIVRIIFIVATFAHGAGLVAYLILAVVVPLESGAGTMSEGEQQMENLFTKAHERTEHIVEDIKHEKNPPESRRNIFGIIIIIVGVLILFNQFMPYGWFSWEYFWGGAIILLGLYILYKK